MGWWMAEGVSRVVGCPRKICLLPGACRKLPEFAVSRKLPEFAAYRKLPEFSVFQQTAFCRGLPEFAANYQTLPILRPTRLCRS